MLKPGVYRVLKPALADIFGVEEDDILPETDLFSELYADEYDMVEISMIIEEEFGKKVKLPKKGPFTVEQLAMKVE